MTLPWNSPFTSKEGGVLGNAELNWEPSEGGQRFWIATIASQSFKLYKYIWEANFFSELKSSEFWISMASFTAFALIHSYEYEKLLVLRE